MKKINVRYVYIGLNMDRINNNLTKELKREIIALRDECNKKDYEIRKLKHILKNIKDVLDIKESDIKVNLNTRPNKPKFSKDEIVLYIHPSHNISRAKILKVYTHEPNYYFYDIIFEGNGVKQTIEDYLMKYSS